MSVAVTTRAQALVGPDSSTKRCHTTDSCALKLYDQNHWSSQRGGEARLTLLVVRHDSLGKSLTDGVDLCGVTTTLDADADIQVGELLGAEQQHGLQDLHAEGLGLHQVHGVAVHTEDTLALLAVCHCGGVTLAAEALNSRSHDDTKCIVDETTLYPVKMRQLYQQTVP